ncbi:Tom7p [Ascoidea rubescens DSM 1968]|uniref:Tom7-domain-containing protein n=1 Tax=Ascoidea rubescens DSM 1968 TaxID=1344418 RepID=A0A1D2VQG4_9ASCO|nr:Tom7-domain-containing protein [Ascoidea rubescens DSM 1968]ODV63828.1 Tom7-domain-containing protein [Ascoidea rubescens DSM 1968]
MAYNFSEESKERIIKVLGATRTMVHYTWVPFILYLGWKSTSNKPNLISLFSPLPSA